MSEWGGSGGREIRRVGVVGAGVMGAGIAQWIAARGWEVVLRDVDSAALRRGQEVIGGLFVEAVRRGKLTAAEAAAGERRVRVTGAWDGFGDCDLVVEAVVEAVAAKRQVWAELAAVVPGDALLASNTSALPIEEFAAEVRNPARTLGLHFFNPVSRMALVEVVRASHTGAAEAERALHFVRRLGKVPVVCRSSPGFLVTRVLFFYLNEAVRQWESGLAAEEIDGALREFGWPMGPLRLIDEVGVDVTDFIFREMAHYFPHRFRLTGACAALLAAGLKGRKGGTSRGFYRYELGGEALNEDEARSNFIGARATSPGRAALADQLMRIMVDEARRCLDEGVVASPAEVDLAFLRGAGFPAERVGLMAWAAGNAAPASPGDLPASITPR